MALCAVLVAASISCFSRAPNQRFQRNVSDIDALYEDGIDEIERAYERELDEVEKLESSLTEVERGSNNSPADPVADEPTLARLGATCEELRRMAISSEDAQVVASFNDCSRKHSEFLVSALAATYWAADLDWISKNLSQRPEELDLESLFVYSHNLRIRGYIAERKRAAQRGRQSALAELRRVRDEAVASAAELRYMEIAENRRAFGAALAAGAQSFSQAGQRQPNPSSSAYSEVTQPVGGCSSDFSCGMGRRCIKNNYSGQGFCAKAVNEYGVQTFDLPSTDSVMAKVPQSSYR